jgi:hypothetical protein
MIPSFDQPMACTTYLCTSTMMDNICDLRSGQRKPMLYERCARVGYRVTRFVYAKIVQNVDKHIFVKVNTKLVPWKNVVQKFALLLYLKKLPE